MNMIKWGCIQPLTGGMYIGALNAIGNDAQWIISYPGLCDIKKNKEGNIISAANEYNLVEWLKKNNKMVPYYTFNRSMFQEDMNINPEIISNDGTTPDFNDIDIVVAVPVCSGLSNVTIAKDDTKDERNCNMLWIAKYVLNNIKPKMYVFENAPGLVGDKGNGVRSVLEKIAMDSDYSIAYYKTDTVRHHNCQKRPRTFCIFTKHTNGLSVQNTPAFSYENITYTAREYFDKMNSNASQNVEFEMSDLNKALVAYVRKVLGDNWREKCPRSLFKYVTDNKLVDDFSAFIDTFDMSEKSKTTNKKWLEHVKDKLSRGLNFYSTAVCTYGDTTPSVQFKSIQTMLHHKEDRLLTVREALYLMGLPDDFELYGDKELNGPKIGQNVPVKTAEWIVKNCVNIINNWDSIERRTDGNVDIFDNTKN